MLTKPKTSFIFPNWLLSHLNSFEVPATAPALTSEPLVDTVATMLPSEPVSERIEVSNITAVRVPPMVTAPRMIALPVVQQAPLPIEELQPVLQSAGLVLVQTAPERHAETLAKMAAEPRPPRARRERPQLAAGGRRSAGAGRNTARVAGASRPVVISSDLIER